MDVIIFVIFVIILYFLPAIVASNKEHPQAGAITVLNFFLGWTLIGWVIALVWAATNESGIKEDIPLTDIATQIEHLHGLKERGIISEEEFNTKKAKLLE